MLEVLALVLFTLTVITFSFAAIGGNYLRHRIEAGESTSGRDATISADLIVRSSVPGESRNAA